VSAEHELTESWKYIPRLQQQVALQGDTLDEQAAWLKSQVDKFLRKKHSDWNENDKFDALSKLSLLSEMYALVDFDKMIEVREKFQSLFPEHFGEYLSHLDSLSWQITWPGCLECRYFNKQCSLGMTPTEPPGGSSKFDRYCVSKELRLKAA